MDESQKIFMPDAPAMQSTQLSHVYFLPPPINQSYPKYSLQLQNQNQVTSLSNSYMAFGQINPLVPPPIPKGELVTSKLKDQMKSLTKEIYKKMMKLVDNFKAYETKEGACNLSVTKICDQTNRLFSHCKQVRSMEVKQQIAHLIMVQTAELTQQTEKIKKSIEEVKSELGIGSAEHDQPCEQGKSGQLQNANEICDYFNNE